MATDSLRETIINELCTFQIPMVDDIFISERATELCMQYFQGDVDDFVSDVLAFRLNAVNNDEPLTREFFDAYERSKANNESNNGRRKSQYAGATPSTKRSGRSAKKQSAHKATSSAFDYGGKSSDREMNLVEPDVMDYQTPESTGDTEFTMCRTPNSSFSEIIISPVGVTPSRLFAERSNAGEVVAAFGDVYRKDWRVDSSIAHESMHSLVVHCNSATALEKQYYYMNQNVRTTQKALQNRVLWMSERMHCAYPILCAETMDVLREKENVVYVCGMLHNGDGMDRTTRLHADSICLRCSSISIGDITVDVSSLPDYSLFSGQVVCFGGRMTAPRKLAAEKIFAGCLPPSVAMDLENLSGTPDRLSVVIASGPFTPSDGFGYEPLVALLNNVQQNRPHVLILIGPILPMNREDILTLPMSYQEFFDHIISTVVEACSKASTQLVVVSSAEDGSSYPCYPTPPVQAINILEKEQPLFVSDPCMLRIGGLILGITASDILFHLSSEEIFKASSADSNRDRMSRLVRHLLFQQTFYPLHPPPLDVTIDAVACKAYANMSVLPHVLVLPSNLKTFLKDVDEVLTVNPGRLTKGRGGGSFCRLEFDKRKLAHHCGDILRCLRVQIVRI